MIRSELVDRIAALNPHLYAKEAEAVVDAILGRIEAALVTGDRVEIRGFGTFAIREKLARHARNPRTGAPVGVEAKSGVHFKPAKGIRVMLSQSERSATLP